MMRSLHHLSRDSRQQTRRRHRHRPLEIQTLEERKLMTVAACVLPAEPAAIVMQNPANPVGANPGALNPGVIGAQSRGC